MLERLARRRMVRACRWWASRYMDQWERFVVQTPHGRVLVTLTREAEEPP